MDRVRLGVIGIGNMGSEHCRIILSGKTPEMELCCVADIRPERRAWAAEALPDEVRIYDSGEALIADGQCDAVLIAAPHYAHPPLTEAALRRGLHVLCEKPIAVYTAQTHAMLQAAEESGKTFALMFNQRTNCVYRRLKQLLDSGELGGMKRVVWTITDWYRSQLYYDSGAWRATWDGEGGGVLLNQCPHQLDLLQWLCGMPTKVRAFCHEAKWHDIEVEDDVTAYLEYENGATGVFVTTTGDAPGTNRLELTFEMGKIVCENGKLLFDKLSVNEREFCRTEKEGFKKPDMEHLEIETDGSNEQHIGVLKAFADHILKGTPLVARGEEGIRGLTLSNAMHLSSWLGETVSIPFDEDLFLAELNKRRALSKKKEDKGVVFDTAGTS